MPSLVRNKILVLASWFVLVPIAAAQPLDELPPGFTSVSFSGGAVQFAHGPQWTASELLDGRDILLVLSRGEPPKTPSSLADGFWIGYQYVGEAAQTSPQIAADRLASRLRRSTRGRARVLTQQSIRVAGFAGMLVEFSLPARPTADRERSFRTVQADLSQRRGVRVQARTKRGWFELHWVSSPNRYAQDRNSVEQLLDSLHLKDPEIVHQELPPQLRSAAKIIGTWKAMSSKFVLDADGRVKLQFDRRKHYRLDEQQRLDYESPVPELAGRFTAQGDLLQITWEDESRRNYRWRIDEGRLMLTDHHGRVSQLHRQFPE